jgi:hypothetical protein
MTIQDRIELWREDTEVLRRRARAGRRVARRVVLVDHPPRMSSQAEAALIFVVQTFDDRHLSGVRAGLPRQG